MEYLMVSEDYAKGIAIVGGLTAISVFIGSWIYCIATYGFLLGVGLGWLPSGIAAVIAGLIAGYLWPLTVFGIITLIYFITESGI
jgi:hypothetical protein